MLRRRGFGVDEKTIQCTRRRESGRTTGVIILLDQEGWRITMNDDADEVCAASWIWPAGGVCRRARVVLVDGAGGGLVFRAGEAKNWKMRVKERRMCVPMNKRGNEGYLESNEQVRKRKTGMCRAFLGVAGLADPPNAGAKALRVGLRRSTEPAGSSLRTSTSRPSLPRHSLRRKWSPALWGPALRPFCGPAHLPPRAGPSDPARATRPEGRERFSALLRIVTSSSTEQPV